MNLFSRWTIRKKCLGLTVFTTLLLLAVAGTGFWGIESLSASAERMLQGEAKIAEHAAAAKNDVLELRRYEKDVFLNCLDAPRVQEYAAKFGEAHASLRKNLDDLRRVATLPQDKEQLRAMSEDLTTYAEAMAGIFAQIQSGEIKTPQDGNRAISEYKDPIHQLEHSAGELAHEGQVRMGRAAEEMADRGRTTRVTMAIFSTAAAMLGLALSLLLSRAITQPLARITAVLEGIAAGAGDLTQRVEVRTADEIGMLGGLINALIRRIHDLVMPIRVATVQLNATATEIAAAAAEQKTAVEGFAGLTAGIAASVQEITATSSALNRTMDDVQGRACEASTLADAGRAGLQQMETTMQQLTSATGSVSAKLGTIREKATGINVMVTTITKVADQTNLLSINAAIEAERAGEAGLGFLVVAREIRRLADQTAAATLDIEQMVGHMQSAVSSGVLEMDRFSDQARNCARQAAEVSRQISQVLETVQTLSRRFQAVNEGMGQQTEGARQIGEAMIRFAGSVKQVNASIHEFSAAAAHLRSSAQGVQQEVGQFTVASA